MNLRIIQQTNINALYYAVILFCLTFICACKSDYSGKDQFLKDHHSPDYKWGYINKQGDLAIKNIYDDVRDFSNGFAAVNYKGKWGYINQLGETKIDFDYKEALPFDGNSFIVKNLDDTWSVLDQNGSLETNIISDRVFKASEGLIKFKDKGAFGFLNNKGDTVIAPTFHKASDFFNGTALCMADGKYSIIDKQGKSHNLNATKVFPLANETYRYKKGKLYGYFSAKGNQIIAPKYNYASDFWGKYAYVELSGIAMIIDAQGKKKSTLSNGEYAFHSPGHYIKIEDSQQRLFDFEGREIANEPYEMFYTPVDGMTAVMRNDKWGFISPLGDLVTPLKYPLVWDFQEGLARYIEPELGIGYLDKSGNIAIKPFFIEVKDFKEGLARIQVYRKR